MNNMLKRLMVAALAISATHLSAYTNKNYLSVARPQHASLLRDSHLTRDLESVKGKDRFGGNFLVSGYYSESRNSAALGKYFGIKDQDKFAANIGDDVASNMLDLSYVVHSHTEGGRPSVPANKLDVSLAPKTTSYGVEFAYTQCLGKILEGLYLEIGLPVERVENNMGLNITGGNALELAAVKGFFEGSYGDQAGAVAAYLAANANTVQKKLNKALFKGKQNATGIADIDVVLGYNFLRNEDWKAGLNLGLVIPTGNTPNGVYVFEPIYGNGGHWELGFGGQLDGRLWSDMDQRINLHASLDYRYGFQANETRTLGLKDKAWGQYYQVGVVGQALTTGTPAANGITQSLSVTPQSKIKGNLGLEYGNGGFLVGVHYAPAWKQEESVKNGKVAANSGVVGAARDVTGGGNFAANFADFTPNTRVAVDADLDQAQATRPSQVEHRLGADLGYTFRNWEYPVMIGVGGHYAFAGENSAAENWGINLKAGIGF